MSQVRGGDETASTASGRGSRFGTRSRSASRARSQHSGIGLHRLYSAQHIDDNSLYHGEAHDPPDEPALERVETPTHMEHTESSDADALDKDLEKNAGNEHNYSSDEDGVEEVEEIRDGIPDSHDIEKQQNSLKKTKSASTAGRESTDPANNHLVTWDGPDDPANPKNWSMRRKWAATVIVSLFTLISPVSSSLVAPALPTIAKDLQTSNIVLQQLMLSIFVLGYAVGPLFLGPLSEIYGRVPVLQLANLFFLAWNTGCGFAQNTPEILVFRFMAGLGGSAPLAIGGGVLSDCWHPHQRGRAIAAYSLAPLVGPALGPIAGGFIAENTTWRWGFWAISLATVGIQIIGFFYLQETYAPKLLHQKMQRLRKETGNELLKTESRLADMTVAKKLRVSIVRPFRLLGTQPIVQVLAIYMAYLYGLIYLVLSTFPGVWTDVYHESVGIGGLNYISLGLGFTIGSQGAAPLNDLIYRRMTERNNGVGRPEFRCPILIPGAALIPIGLFWYGWSAQAGIHWIMPNIGACIFAAGGIIIFQGLQTYIVDAYSRYAASAVAAAACLRSFAGFGFPLFAPAMYDTLHYGWGNSLLGFIAIAIGVPAPLLLWKYGAQLRAKSKYAAG